MEHSSRGIPGWKAPFSRKPQHNSSLVIEKIDIGDMKGVG